MVLQNIVPSDLEIAQQAKLVHINRIAEQMGLDPDTDLEHYGKYMAKINLDVLDRLQPRPNAKYVDVTAITPTPLGEGKTTTTVGLGQGIRIPPQRAAVGLPASAGSPSRSPATFPAAMSAGRCAAPLPGSPHVAAPAVWRRLGQPPGQDSPGRSMCR